MAGKKKKQKKQKKSEAKIDLLSGDTISSYAPAKESVESDIPAKEAPKPDAASADSLKNEIANNDIVKAVGKETKRVVSVFAKYKYIFIPIIIILFLVFFFFGAKIVLYVHYLFGNDILLKVNVNNDSFLLHNGEDGNVAFEFSSTTNPFCNSDCTYEFIDLSSNTSWDKKQLILPSTIPYEVAYTIKAPDHGSGINLYRFTLSCSSRKTNFCYTSQEPARRDILITLAYDLTDEEKANAKRMKDSLNILSSKLAYLQDESDRLGKMYEAVSEFISLKNISYYEVNSSIADTYYILVGIMYDWNASKFNVLSNSILTVQDELASEEAKLSEMNSTLTESAAIFNNLVVKMNEIRRDVDYLEKQSLLNESKADEINNVVDNYNYVAQLFLKKDLIQKKTVMVNDFYNQSKAALNSTIAEIKSSSIGVILRVNSDYDLLCGIIGNCTSHKAISQISSEEVNIDSSCNDLKSLRDTYASLNLSFRQKYNESNYSSSASFNASISTKIAAKRQEVYRKYLSEIPYTGINDQEITAFLIKELNATVVDDFDPDYNLTAALIISLIDNQMKECVLYKPILKKIASLGMDELEFDITPLDSSPLEFVDPAKKCCVLGKCTDCCTDYKCGAKKKYPIIFVHGHAFNKGVSAYYSLEGFNPLQNYLENEGYINAGTISIYSRHDSPQGLLSEVPSSLSFKGSYYLDIFKQPDSYVVVQTKSENIDTYAIRLKDMVDTVKYRTGSPKVTLLGHSMGGLVSRRYVQLFGDDSVDKIILVSVPNKGITKKIYDYCGFLGERLECRDMSSESLFMNKLNHNEFPDVPIYNVITTGCKMDNETGDGIVTENNQFLDGARNFVIKGNCSGVDFLHISVLNPEKYPELESYISKVLNN
jgi:hypothetical protein